MIRSKSALSGDDMQATHPYTYLLEYHMTPLYHMEIINLIEENRKQSTFCRIKDCYINTKPI